MLNRFVRDILLAPSRIAAFKVSNYANNLRAVKRGRDSFEDPVVPDDALLRVSFRFPPLAWQRAIEWFGSLHELNEYLRTPDGAWAPQPFANYFGKGIPVEDVALRILGYLHAYEATGEEIFLTRALAAGDYLVRKRRFADGHLLLQGHTVIDTTYTFAGLAWLAIADISEDPKWLAYARSLGDRLVEYHIAGSVNHAATPVQLLGPLYMKTGDERYLRAAVKRLRTAVIPFQLPYGGWPSGHESWTWYHSISTKSLIRAYIAMPFTLDYYAFKDKVARSIYRALNRLVASQESDGRIKSGRGKLLYSERDEYGSDPLDQWATFEPGRGIYRVPRRNAHEFYGYELDCLCTARLELPCPELDVTIDGLASYLAAKQEFWRPEFNTMAAGHYLRFRKGQSEARKQTMRSVA